VNKPITRNRLNTSQLFLVEPNFKSAPDFQEEVPPAALPESPSQGVGEAVGVVGGGGAGIATGLAVGLDPGVGDSEFELHPGVGDLEIIFELVGGLT